MNDEQRRRSERLSRAHAFGTSRAADFPDKSKGGESLARLGAVITRIADLDASRNTSQRNARQGTAAKNETIAALRQQLKSISRTAATIALDMPELKNKFRAPATNLNRQELLALARSFRAEAAPLKAKFIEYDLPATFLDDLDNNIARFEQAHTQQFNSADASTTNRAALDKEIASGEQELERLDTSVRNKFNADAPTLAAWDSARHLENAPRKSKQSKSVADKDSAPVGKANP